MATSYSITQVHLERAPGATHDHIARVKLLGHGGDYARADIIRAIRTGDIFWTYAVQPAKVIVRACPVCGSRDYITTEPDSTPKNNLLDLPRY